MMDSSGSGPPSPEDFGDETMRCHDLVRLAFRAVLRREPEEGDEAAFTNALVGGMPVYDFISELMAAPEFRADPVSVPIGPPVALSSPPLEGDALSNIMGLSLEILQARLTDKGCLLQLGPVPDPSADQGATATRMERVVRTLAMLDAL